MGGALRRGADGRPLAAERGRVVRVGCGCGLLDLYNLALAQSPVASANPAERLLARLIQALDENVHLALAADLTLDEEQSRAGRELRELSSSQWVRRDLHRTCHLDHCRRRRRAAPRLARLARPSDA
jgi:hypothetical protein